MNSDSWFRPSPFSSPVFRAPCPRTNGERGPNGWGERAPGPPSNFRPPHRRLPARRPQRRSRLGVARFPLHLARFPAPLPLHLTRLRLHPVRPRRDAVLAVLAVHVARDLAPLRVDVAGPRGGRADVVG